jgi:hypothetical protein
VGHDLAVLGGTEPRPAVLTLPVPLSSIKVGPVAQWLARFLDTEEVGGPIPPGTTEEGSVAQLV